MIWIKPVLYLLATIAMIRYTWMSIDSAMQESGIEISPTVPMNVETDLFYFLDHRADSDENGKGSA